MRLDSWRRYMLNEEDSERRWLSRRSRQWTDRKRDFCFLPLPVRLVLVPSRLRLVLPPSLLFAPLFSLLDDDVTLPFPFSFSRLSEEASLSSSMMLENTPFCPSPPFLLSSNLALPSFFSRSCLPHSSSSLLPSSSSSSSSLSLPSLSSSLSSFSSSSSLILISTPNGSCNSGRNSPKLKLSIRSTPTVTSSCPAMLEWKARKC
mmetsp:Transcript_23829/g.60183  ORF Transcript_23829/g.60183 Transcript_23829/m.60183 type:complete len:204 (+) Transcript_23829:644-1255(+)